MKINLDECEDIAFPIIANPPLYVKEVLPIMEHEGVKVGDKYEGSSEPFTIKAFILHTSFKGICMLTDRNTWTDMEYLRQCTKLT